MPARTLPALVLAAITLSGCSTLYYKAWEKLGKEKRDLLRSNVEKVKGDQEEATEQFQDALTRIRELHAFDGGDLEKHYDRLKSDYEKSESRADDLRNRIDKIEEIAGDLFTEWDAEIGEISSSDMRRRSREQLDATKKRYAKLESALHETEKSMDPVLQKLKDQVLFLKHNLNATAVGGLEAEASRIEGEIGSLIQDMKRSIELGNEFIAELPQ